MIFFFLLLSLACFRSVHGGNPASKVGKVHRFGKKRKSKTLHSLKSKQASMPKSSLGTPTIILVGGGGGGGFDIIYYIPRVPIRGGGDASNRDFRQRFCYSRIIATHYLCIINSRY